MACNPDVLNDVPLFSLLDADEKAVLAGQVELKTFAARERIYKMGEPGGRAYVVVSGRVRLTTVDDDQQEVTVDEPGMGEFFGFASMLDETPHQTDAFAVEESVCLEVDRHDITILIERKPHAGMDMLTVLGRHFHAAQQLVRTRATRNPNDVIEERATTGERVADAVAVEETECLEVSRDDIATLLQRKPLAGMDLLTVLGRQFHASQDLVRLRATRNPNAVIESRATFGERVADSVARFGGSWVFIIVFSLVLTVYTTLNVSLHGKAWDPYPFILLNLFLSMLAAVQAPVIMMSQNRQDAKDRLRGELDYDVNRRSESEIQGLARKLNQLDEKIGDVEELLRNRA